MKYTNEELLKMEEQGIDLSTVDMGPISAAKAMPPMKGEVERHAGPVFEKGTRPDRHSVRVNLDLPPDMLAAFDCVVTRLGLTRQAMMRTLLDGFLSDKIRALKERDEFLEDETKRANAKNRF